MARLSRQIRSGHRHRIAVVDDDPHMVASMVHLLESEGHEVFTAATPSAAVALVRARRPHLILLDYQMPGGTGADVVSQVRTFDSTAQVLLVTGYANEHPARRLLAELDIQGFHDKADGPQRLLVLIDAALKHYRALERVQRQQDSLRHILDKSPEIVRLQSECELLRSALTHLGPLIAGGAGFIATANNGLFVFHEAAEGISIHAATGRFADTARFSALSPELARVVHDGLGERVPFFHPCGFVVIPLETRNGDRGCMVIEALALAEHAVEPCRIYAQLVVQALENVVLFERATIDPLTQVYNRGFGMQRLSETLRLAQRTDDTTGLVMLDLDYFKRLNDSLGHAAGDVTLRAVAAALRATCRTTDVIARYGGEEFFVVLPATDEEGTRVLAERLRHAVRNLVVPFEGKSIGVTASFGAVCARPLQHDGPALLRRADAALYRAKRAGRDRVELDGEVASDARHVA